ncbi:hypothetical protein EJC49_20015 [Aquibium carbonis]|uniref:Uncharacterized protein n=1 Tax=Aquibium carbonis TaxID=2495581 RepID=A0A429YT11_9HYPH|nr:hypothetical protein [Aquibium carbonis]RST84605.1 hypothetical protein EJC49_20015 [Aquibium carbonis]
MDQEAERDAEDAENWALVTMPLGEPWSGRARYAAAMHFYRQGIMNAETLEVYRLCSRLDDQDPLPLLRERRVGRDWIARVESRRTGR